MRIAQVAPLTEAVPPKLYGGTERVVHWLTEELVALGHEVTLFASGDSRTSAKLDATWPKALRLDGSVRDPYALHMVMLERVRQKCDDEEFDFLHFHLDYFSWSLFSRQPTPFVTTLHGRLDLPEHQPVFNTFPSAPVISISNAQRRPVPQANWVRTIHHGLPENLLMPKPVSRDYLAVLGRIAPELLRRTDLPADHREPAGRIYRRDQRPREIGLSQRRNRVIGSDRLAGTVWSCDDRSHGLRHAGDRLQPRLGR